MMILKSSTIKTVFINLNLNFKINQFTNNTFQIIILNNKLILNHNLNILKVYKMMMTLLSTVSILNLTLKHYINNLYQPKISIKDINFNPNNNINSNSNKNSNMNHKI